MPIETEVPLTAVDRSILAGDSVTIALCGTLRLGERHRRFVDKLISSGNAKFARADESVTLRGYAMAAWPGDMAGIYSTSRFDDRVVCELLTIARNVKTTMDMWHGVPGFTRAEFATSESIATDGASRTHRVLAYGARNFRHYPIIEAQDGVFDWCNRNNGERTTRTVHDYLTRSYDDEVPQPEEGIVQASDPTLTFAHLRRITAPMTGRLAELEANTITGTIAQRFAEELGVTTIGDF